MSEETKTSNICQSLAAIMADAKAIGKDSKNQQQGFNFRGIDAVMNHLHPLFAKHGVIVLPKVLSDKSEERTTKSGGALIYRLYTMQFDFVARDGSRESCVVIGEGMDTGDKAGNKAMAVALKYALTQMLLLPYDEVDPDGTTPPASIPKPKPASKPTVSQEEVDANKKFAAGSETKETKDARKITAAQRKRLFAIIRDQGIDESEFRQWLVDELGTEHTSDITQGNYEDVCQQIMFMGTQKKAGA